VVGLKLPGIGNKAVVLRRMVREPFRAELSRVSRSTAFACVNK
jgi:hypothetical protein